MTFAVVLTPAGEQDLAAAWLAARDRPAVTLAANSMEEALARDPLHVGESRESSVNRVAVSPPLAFQFDVVVDDAVVFVTAVWLLQH